MINLPKDVAERLYAIYDATLMNPLPLEEMVLADRVQWAYEKGKVKPEQQLSWVRNLHRQNADLHEPYDVGVLNALALAVHIFAEGEGVPVFAEKPESEDLQEQFEKAGKRAFALAIKVRDLNAILGTLKKDHALEINETLKKTAEELKAVKKVHTDRLAAMAGEESSEVKKLKETVKKLRSDLKAAKSALKTASVTV